MALVVDSSLAEERVMDSGAIEHMSRSKEWFTNYTPLTGKKVRQGDSFLTVHGMGKIIPVVKLYRRFGEACDTQ
jgi:glutamine synthetase type III